MANRIKNGNEFSPVSNRGRRVRGSFAVRTLQSLKFFTRKRLKEMKKAEALAS
jgi:hypothetical protein